MHIDVEELFNVTVGVWLTVMEKITGEVLKQFAELVPLIEYVVLTDGDTTNGVVVL